MLAAWLARGVGGEARRRAIRSVGRLPGARARAAVLTLAHAPLPLDRADALLALGEGGRAEDAPAVAAGLSDEAPAVRAAACLALSWCGRGPAAGVLEAHMAGEKSPDVRDAALFALSRLRGADLLLGAPPEALSVDANGVVKVSAEEEG
jgi:HEAT repeat protein